MEKYKKTVKYNKLKVIASTWNDKLEFQYDSYSVSNIQGYID